MAGGDIYKQTGGTGSFVDVSNASGIQNWNSITSTPSGDVYGVVGGGDIYKIFRGDGGNVNITSSTIGGIKQSGNNSSSNSITLSNSTSTAPIYAFTTATTTISDSVTGNISNTGTGALVITGTNVNLSNNTYNLIPSSTLSINYSGNVATTNTNLSTLAHLIINGSDYTYFPGGAYPVFPGTINSCGTIFLTGTYTLGLNITGVPGACFNVKNNNVTIDGSSNHYTVTASSSNSSYAITATTNSTIENGGFAYNPTIQNIIFSGFGGGVNASGYSSVIDAGGSAGNIIVSTSTIGSIVTSGGVGYDGSGGDYCPIPGLAGLITVNNSTTTDLTSLGGNIPGCGAQTGGTITITNSKIGSVNSNNGTTNITGTNIDLSNNTYNVSTLNLFFSGTINSTNTLLSGTTIYLNSTLLTTAQYAIGVFPLIPDNLRGSSPLNSCGNILTTGGIYTLSSSITGVSGTCFNVLANNVTIDGSSNHYTVTATSSNSSYAVLATTTSYGLNGGNAYGTTTVQNITFSGFSGGVNASGNDSLGTYFGGANGGGIIVSSSTLGNILASGGSAATSTSSQRSGGFGGAVIITNSNIGTIVSNGGNSGNSTSGTGTGGRGGVITISSNSNTGAVTSQGGNSHHYTAGKGRAISISSNSTAGAVTSQGGIAVINNTGGSISIVSSSTINGNASSIGGVGYASGGSIVLATSSLVTGNITSSGANMVSGNPAGLGGAISITANSTVLGTILSIGGNGSYHNGSGGIVTVSSSVVATTTSQGGTGGSDSNYGNPGNVTFTNATSTGLISSVMGSGGLGATTTIANSTTKNITNTGVGSVIVISDTNLNLSNNTYISSSTLSLLYSGALSTTNTTLSPLSHLAINSNDLGAYIGGLFPLIPGNISSCGTIYYPGTYTLTGNSTSNCDIQTSGVTIVGASGGAQKVLTGNITTNNFGATISNLSVSGVVSTTGATPGALTLNNTSNLTGTVNVTGILNGDGSSLVGNTTINSGALVATSSVIFIGDVLNNGTINPGNPVLGKTINNSTINGDFTFNTSSINSGTVNGNAIFNTSSTNYLTATTSIGTVTGNATFAMYTADGNGAVSFGGTTAFGGTGNVGGSVYASGTVPIISWIFNASSTNIGILKGNAIFNNTSTNTGAVTGNSDVYYPVSRPLGGTTVGQVVYHNYPGLYFNDSTTGHGVVGKWNDILNWWTDASSTIHAPVLPTYGDDVTILVGNLTTATSSIAYANTFTFQGITTNSITIWSSSTSTSAALFNASSTNGVSGTVHGNATFYGPGTDNLGSVSGYITRQYGSPIVIVGTILHNTTYLTVQAINGVVVDLTNATYNLTNYFFQALNNASFIWATITGSNGGVGAPVLNIVSTTLESNARWAPSISWGNTTSCYYKLDSGNYTSVTCANNGSDIPRPSAGTHTLYVKSINGNNITEKSTTFTYDNTLPVSTDCSQPLDEGTRPYYYLNSNVGSCNITASTTLRGDNNGGGNFYTIGSITGSSTNVSLTNITATGTISNFNNITVASSTLSGNITVNGIFTSDTKSTFGNTTIASGGTVNSGNFVGTLTNNGTITNSTTTPVTVALSTTNNSTITGGFTFNATSTNTGTVNGNVTLNDSSANAGIINGDLTFGTLTAVNGAVTFSGVTLFTGTNINLGSNTVSGNIYDNHGNRITTWVFIGTSANIGSLKGDTFFNATSTNLGSIYGNAHFSDASANLGTVSGTIDVYGALSDAQFVGATSYHSYPNVPSFKNISGDNSWNNASNWFAFATSSIPLGRLPDNTDKNLVLFASTTLPSDITSNVFIATASSTVDGGGHTLNGNVSGNGVYGGVDAYSFNLQNITVTGTTTANGGNGSPTGNGGRGGVINVYTSSTGVITVNGGDPQHNGGDAGQVNINNSYATINGTPLLAVGGDSVGCGYGGNGGNISLIDSSGYILITDPGKDAIASCGGSTPHGSSGQRGDVFTRGVYISPAQRAAALALANKPAIGTSVARIIANLQTITLPINVLPKLNLTTLPTFGGIAKNSFSFISPIENFLIKFFAPSVTTLGTAELNFPSLRTLLLKQGIVREQAVAALSVTPKRLLDTNSEGLFTVKGLTSKLTGDAKDIVYQKITTQPNKTITISLIPTNNKLITGTFNNQPITFNKDNTITLTTPQNPGTYFLRTPSSPIPLAVVVTKITPAPEPTIPTKPITLWSVVWNWFTGR